MNPRAYHVYPSGDLIEHDLDDDCVCGPTSERVAGRDGSDGWVIVHHSLDNREYREVGKRLARAARRLARFFQAKGP